MIDPEKIPLLINVFRQTGGAFWRFMEVQLTTKDVVRESFKALPVDFVVGIEVGRASWPRVILSHDVNSEVDSPAVLPRWNSDSGLLSVSWASNTVGLWSEAQA